VWIQHKSHMVGCTWLPSLTEKTIELATTLLMVTSHSHLHIHTLMHTFWVYWDKSVHSNDNLLKNGIGCISRFCIRKKRKFIDSCLPACDGTMISHSSLYITCTPSHISTTIIKFTHPQWVHLLVTKYTFFCYSLKVLKNKSKPNQPKSNHLLTTRTSKSKDGGAFALIMTSLISPFANSHQLTMARRETKGTVPQSSHHAAKCSLWEIKLIPSMI